MSKRLFMINFKKIIILLIVSIFIINCKPIVSDGRFFSYPKGTSPFENNWQYRMYVGIESQREGIFGKAKRIVKLFVTDKNKNTLLKEEYKIERISFYTPPVFDAVWDDYKALTINVSERGNPRPDIKDEYNDLLLKNGPKLLLELQYEFDKNNKCYKKVKELYGN